jgi:hypothetical protein
MLTPVAAAMTANAVRTPLVVPWIGDDERTLAAHVMQDNRLAKSDRSREFRFVMARTAGFTPHLTRTRARA